MTLFFNINFIAYCDSEVEVLTSVANDLSTSSDPLVGIALFTLSVACWCVPFWWSMSSSGSSNSSCDSDSSKVNQSDTLINDSLQKVSEVSSESPKLSVQNPSLLDSTESVSPEVFVDTPTPDSISELLTPVENIRQSLFDPIVTNILYQYNNNDPIFIGRLDLDKLISHLKVMIVNSIIPLETISSLADFDNAEEISSENPFDTLSYKVPRLLRTQLALKGDINGSEGYVLSDPSHFIVTTTYRVNDQVFVNYDLSQIVNLVNNMHQQVFSQLPDSPLIIERFAVIATFLNDLPLLALS